MPVHADLTADKVLGGRVSLFQPAEGYRAAIDPVLLAASVPADVRSGSKSAGAGRVVDLGCGVGTAGLCLLARLSAFSCLGIDVQPALVDLANRNAATSGLADRYRAKVGNILDDACLRAAGPADHVIANPPYLPRGQASVSDHPVKALANVESDAVLADWVAAAIAIAAPRGHVTFIHRADRLPELLSLMQDRLGDLAILPIQPKPGEPARRVLVRGQRGNHAPARLLAPFVLHEADGRFTSQAEAVLRDAGPILL